MQRLTKRSCRSWKRRRENRIRSLPALSLQLFLKNPPKQQLIPDVTLAYFQILNNRDLLELFRLRLEATKKQTHRLKNLYNQGEGNPADYTDIPGQISNDEPGVVDVETQPEQSGLELANLLNPDTLSKVQEMIFLKELEKHIPYEMPF